MKYRLPEITIAKGNWFYSDGWHRASVDFKRTLESFCLTESEAGKLGIKRPPHTMNPLCVFVNVHSEAGGFAHTSQVAAENRDNRGVQRVAVRCIECPLGSVVVSYEKLQAAIDASKAKHFSEVDAYVAFVAQELGIR